MWNLMGAVVAEWLSSWLAEQEVRGSIPRLATWISEIGYLLLPSRDTAEIPLKRRKSSIQPTNQWNLMSKFSDLQQSWLPGIPCFSVCPFLCHIKQSTHMCSPIHSLQSWRPVVPCPSVHPFPPSVRIRPDWPTRTTCSYPCRPLAAWLYWSLYWHTENKCEVLKCWKNPSLAHSGSNRPEVPQSPDVRSS